MQQTHRNPFTRPDTLFGVCQALGEDLRFNPMLLRLPLALPLVWKPTFAIGAYLALGIIVLLSRLLFPVPPKAVAMQEPQVPVVLQPAEQPSPEPVLEEMAIAA